MIKTIKYALLSRQFIYSSHFLSHLLPQNKNMYVHSYSSDLVLGLGGKWLLAVPHLTHLWHGPRLRNKG